MEGKTNFSRSLKRFDGLTRLTPSYPFILRQIYTTAFTLILAAYNVQPHVDISTFESDETVIQAINDWFEQLDEKFFVGGVKALGRR